MGWQISKQFNFSYGHRVWCQSLNDEFSLGRKLMCRHLHGHEAEVHVSLTSGALNPQGMVVDFCNLAWLKKFFDEAVDHRFILDISDPLFEKLVDLPKKLIPVYVPDTDHCAGHLIDMAATGIPVGTPEYEYYESFFIVDFIPTSENLSKWVFDLATPKMARLGVKVDEVTWWETPKSKSVYNGL